MRIYGLSDLIQDAEKTISDTTDQTSIVETIGESLRLLMRNERALPSTFMNRPPDSQRGRYMVHREEGFVITTVIWSPGEVAPPHNHETWGVIGVLSNGIEERRYDEKADLRLTQVDQGYHKAGEVSLLVPDEDIHSMHNTSATDTVEIHIYGKDLTGLKRKTWPGLNGPVEFASGKYLNC